MHTWGKSARKEQRVLQGGCCLEGGEDDLLCAGAQVCAVQFQAGSRIQA